MAKAKNTKKALLASIISIMLCLAMLVGSTFAWFTDSVTSGMNKVVAGTLDIELEYCKDPSAENADWQPVQGADNLFDIELWEPGVTGVVYFRLSNRGTLALKYQLGMNFTDTVIGESVTDKEIKLSEVLMFGIAAGQNETFESREDAIAAIQANEKALGAGYTDGQNVAVTDDKTYFALVVYMPERVGNDANYKTGTPPPSIDLGVTLVATQLNSESDSFGPDYDVSATFSEVSNADDHKVYDAETLLQKSSDESEDTIEIQLGGDITATETVITVAEGNTVSVDFENNELTIVGDITGVKCAPGAILTLSNGKITGSDAAIQLLSVGDDTDAAVPFIDANGGTIILDNMTIVTETGSCVVSTGANGYLYIWSSSIDASNSENVAVFVGADAAAEIDVDSERVTGSFNVTDGGSLVIFSGYFTADPTNYLSSDENGYSIVGDALVDGYYAVVRIDESDFEDPFGDE